MANCAANNITYHNLKFCQADSDSICKVDILILHGELSFALLKILGETPNKLKNLIIGNNRCTGFKMSIL